MWINKFELNQSGIETFDFELIKPMPSIVFELNQSGIETNNISHHLY